jgi:hypothetical protein
MAPGQSGACPYNSTHHCVLSPPATEASLPRSIQVPQDSLRVGETAPNTYLGR